MNLTSLLVSAAVLFILGGCMHVPQKMASVVPSGQLVIDVRTAQEWKDGHLAGAVLIPYDRIEQGISTVASDKGIRIYLYCRTGRRTGIAFDVLKKAGYENLVNLGTMENASRELGLPIVK